MATDVTEVHTGEAHEHEHPGELTYIKVAAILAAVTVVEVAIYYISDLRDILVPALIILSVAKFLAVVSYFMHLKFDDRRLAWTFALAMILTISIVLSLDVLHDYHAIDYAGDFLTGGE
jgi:cytochrome c oxidase subunit 4